MASKIAPVPGIMFPKILWLDSSFVQINYAFSFYIYKLARHNFA